MKKSGIMQHRLAEVIATMGHGDIIVIADAGLPIPPGVERIDLAVSPGVPGVLDVARAIADELQVERIMIATELEKTNSKLAKELVEVFAGAQSGAVGHDAFKQMTVGARAIVRTGECTPYANALLVSGVTF